MLLEEQPGAAMVIGGGYLVKRGDIYELKAEMKKGLLTVNGAPMPIPFGGLPLVISRAVASNARAGNVSQRPAL